MKVQIKHYITINNQKYYYALGSHGKKEVFVECPSANIAQKFLNEDVPSLLNDLPNLILAEKKYKKQQSETIRFRVHLKDKIAIEKNALKKGYTNVSSYLRDLALG